MERLGLRSRADGNTADAVFTFVTEDGTIVAWGPGINPPDLPNSGTALKLRGAHLYFPQPRSQPGDTFINAEIAQPSQGVKLPCLRLSLVLLAFLKRSACTRKRAFVEVRRREPRCPGSNLGDRFLCFLTHWCNQTVLQPSHWMKKKESQRTSLPAVPIFPRALDSTI